MGRNCVSIIGAGLAGLSTAWHLQKSEIPCCLYEKNTTAGGLCRSKKISGFTFDYDGHVLHFRHREAFDLVRELLNDNLVKHRRDSWVYCDERFIRYPFQANLYGLSRPVLKECLTGFIKAKRRAQDPGKENFLKWIEGTFGDGIAGHFMIPYNTKFWTIHPRQMTGEWLDGFIPQPSMDRVIDGAVHDSRQLLGYNSHFWYPRKGGIGQLASAFANDIRNIHNDFCLAEIDLQQRRMVFTNGETREFSDLVSTIPLPELGSLIKDLPAEVERAFGLLRWNSILNVNLGLRQENPSSRHWIYFPQENLSFFRVGFFHNFSADLTPPGMTSLYAEVSYSRYKPINRETIIARIEKDLRKVGLLNDGDNIECRDVNDIVFGYPIYDNNYAPARQVILAFLRQHRVLCCGRYGGWRYMSMEDVIMEGKGMPSMLIDPSFSSEKIYL